MATRTTIDFVVVTPERQVLEETAEALVIPAHDGELGVLPQRAPLMCELGVGQMRYQKGGRTHRLFIDGGFAQVHDNRVIVLTAAAARPEEITDEMISQAEHAGDAIEGRTPEDIEARTRCKRRADVLRRMRAAS